MKKGFRIAQKAVFLLVTALFMASLGIPPADDPAPARAVAPDLSLSRIPWEGGASYWAQFGKANAAGWDDPSFFPISVFLSNGSDAAALKAAGINTYVGVNHTPPISTATDEDMFVIAQGDWLGGGWTQGEIGNDPKVVGWFISDECEMGLSNCDGVDKDGDTDVDEYDRLIQQQEYLSTALGYNDGRFSMANFGNGVVRTFWATNTMDDHVQMMDITSADKYVYTSPDVRSLIDGAHDAPDWPNGTPTERSYAYGWLVDQMKRFQDPAHLRPIWGVVESSQPLLNEAGAREILPDEMEGAIWSSLIHEARGLMYFQHSNGADCTGYSIVACPDVTAKVTAVNAQVKSLAPVLNTQSYYNTSETLNGHTFYRYTFSNGTDTMLKTYNGSAYIFAGIGMGQTPGSKVFTLPEGVNGSTVTVVGENRTLAVDPDDRTFTDNFAAEYSHHVYQVSQGVTADDYDGDGTPDATEDAGPNSGDANGDGTPDSQQSNVSTVANPIGGGYSSLQLTGGCQQVTQFSIVAENSLAATDTANDYPVGLFDFDASCTNPGDNAQITVFLDKAYDTSEWAYEKYHAATQSYTAIPVTFGAATVGGAAVTTISFSVQDGGPLDEDGTANGVFRDPSGPALLPGETIVATAPQTGLPAKSMWLPWAALTGGIVLAAAVFSRKKVMRRQKFGNKA